MTTTKKNHRAPRRQAFRCTGQQFDAIVRFAEERKLDNLPLQVVVAEYSRCLAKAA